MTKSKCSISIHTLASLLVFVFGVMASAATTADLSKYRNFQLGTNLPAIVKQTNTTDDQVKIVHRRPALIQELEWRPQAYSPGSSTESVKDVIFSFYNGALFRVLVTYDRYETEGMTSSDFVEAISKTYGIATVPIGVTTVGRSPYGDPGEVLAQWQDSQHRFELIRFSYGSEVKLLGVLKELDASAQAAILEAVKLDRSEAPQREADRIASGEEAARVKSDKARLVNKPKFRP